MIQEKKLVQFGAGRIGRSFIGQLFSRGGYDVVFIDISKKIIDELNNRRQYKVIIKSKEDKVLTINNVRGVYFSDENTVAQEVSTAGIVSVSTGIAALSEVIRVLAKGLWKRFKEYKSKPLDIIIAENMRNADQFFQNELRKSLPDSYPISQLVGLIETSIGKMVPVMHPKNLDDDVLQIYAEPYNTLIVSKHGFKNQIPQIAGLAPKDNIKAWVDRKLFIHNLGHASAAYVGYVHHPKLKYLYEVLEKKEVYNRVRDTMRQSSDILEAMYPSDFKSDSILDHIEDLLCRFQNKALGDTVFRVGSGLKRKLGPEDRLVAPIKAALKLGLPYDKILYVLVCGIHFKPSNHDAKMLTEDIEFLNNCEGNLFRILEHICGFDKKQNCKLFKEAETIENQIHKK